MRENVKHGLPIQNYKLGSDGYDIRTISKSLKGSDALEAEE